jgi:hypothetical protein
VNEVGRWAHQFLPPSGSIGTLELLTRLSQGINYGFLYRRREAKGIQLPVETLRRKSERTNLAELIRGFGVAGFHKRQRNHVPPMARKSIQVLPCSWQLRQISQSGISRYRGLDGASLNDQGFDFVII